MSRTAATISSSQRQMRIKDVATKKPAAVLKYPLKYPYHRNQTGGFIKMISSEQPIEAAQEPRYGYPWRARTGGLEGTLNDRENKGEDLWSQTHSRVKQQREAGLKTPGLKAKATKTEKSEGNAGDQVDLFIMIWRNLHWSRFTSQ